MPHYDASGNQTLIRTSTGIWTVQYNAENRPVSFTSRDGSTVVECGYDYQGRRYMKKVTENGTVTSHERYLYRGYLQLAALDMLNSRNVLRTLLWDPLEPVTTRPLALVQDNALYCYGTDFNKNVTEVFDAQGTIATAYDYSPYGTVTGTGSLVQPVQWSSEMNDYELTLVYYNSADGRWINRDPIAEEGGWNLYGFVKNNPVNNIDELGESITSNDCERIAGKVEKNPSSLSSYLNKLIEKMKKRKCDVPLIYCSCANDEDYGRAVFDNTRNMIFVYYDNVRSVEILIKVIQHEFIHALDFCEGTDFGDCDSFACSEIRAYLNDGGCVRAKREGIT